MPYIKQIQLTFYIYFYYLLNILFFKIMSIYYIIIYKK